MSLDFNLVSEFTSIHRRSFELNDATLLDPSGADPLVLGEWLELLPTGGGKMIRGASGAAGSLVPSFPVFSERGRYETQALGKVPMLYMGAFEADTKIFDATGIVTVGQPLMVADTGVGAQRGLKLHTGAGVLVVGYVTRLPTNNNGFLRFIRTLT